MERRLRDEGVDEAQMTGPEKMLRGKIIISQATHVDVRRLWRGRTRLYYKHRLSLSLSAKGIKVIRRSIFLGGKL